LPRLLNSKFLLHRGLIVAAVGGAVAECALLAVIAPGARSVAPQVTAVPSVAAYHDLRWLFLDGQSWLWFAGLVAAVLVARAAADAVLLRLAWPGGVPAPALRTAFVSCAALTLVAWMLLSPATTLTFGAAVLPFSWPFLAAFPVMFGIVVLLSHGGVSAAWWRRLPPPRAVGWLLVSFVAASAAGAVIAHLPAAASVAVAALAGLVNARAWYGLAAASAQLRPRAHVTVPGRVLFGLPVAPIAAVLVLVLVVGVVRLMFDGTIQLPINPVVTGAAVSGTGSPASASGDPSAIAAAAAGSAVLVVGGFGSSCCDAANGLHVMLPSTPMRQFSYVGLDADGRPIPSGSSADDLPLPELGDRLAVQVTALSKQAKRPVAIVAESEGTLGVYAMFARHPGLPVSAVVLLSPIVSPGQPGYAGEVPGAALNELNHLVGGISPYGPSGAANLLSSAGEFGAGYFADMLAATGADSVRLLVVVPLADAVTLPQCALPPGVFVVPAFHGGLLGDAVVLPMVSSFLAGEAVTYAENSRMRQAAELIIGVAAPWRMPDVSGACPSPSG
jgi:hypothetical protein